ncbi:hypothetical protein [Plantibacter flavus]|nr:hypothetical protein [Plantibacter flavus]
MTEVALAEAAYADMRRPGVDPSSVRDRYDSALSALYEYVDDDGIRREDVSRSMRVIVGQRVAREPQLASVFSELGHGRFAKSEPREVFLEGGVERATVWTGDFVDSYEGRTISSGSFRLRPPASISEHRVLIAETLAAEMATATSVGELNDALSQYVVASSASKYPDVVDQLEDPATRTRFSKARTMFASMSDDGLSGEEQRFAYTAAYVDAVETTHRLNPEMGAQWAAQYGENWREDVAEAIRRYNDLGAQAASGSGTNGAPQAARATPRSPGPSTSGAPRRPSARPAGAAGTRQDPSPERARTRGAVEEMVYAGDVEDALPVDGIIDGELVGDIGQLGAGANRRAITSAPERAAGRELDVAGSASAQQQAQEAITGGAGKVSSAAAYDQTVALTGTASRVRRALVNQHYNEVETGGFTGLGRDDATPLQDVDFNLG